MILLAVVSIGFNRQQGAAKPAHLPGGDLASHAAQQASLGYPLGVLALIGLGIWGCARVLGSRGAADETTDNIADDIDTHSSDDSASEEDNVGDVENDADDEDEP